MPLELQPWPPAVTIREEGPRDGWQNIDTQIPTAEKIRLINQLVAAGFRRLMLTSFVHPRWVPQLADAEAVCLGVEKPARCAFAVLIPNYRGLERVLAVRERGAKIDEVTLVISASEAHNRSNVNSSVAESLAAFVPVVDRARREGLKVNGGIGTSFGCPFAGRIAPAAVAAVARSYASMGVQEVMLADTTGMANPRQVPEVVTAVRAAAPDVELTLHFHNTRGAGLANVLAGLQAGVTSFESAYGELGGCNFVSGATGNIATEDLVNMLHEMGIATGIDLAAVLAVSRATEALLGRRLESHVLRAGPPRWEPGEGVGEG